MVLAAGLGTRMRPFTLDRPKALVCVAGRPLIDHMLDRLADAGVERAVVNVHAFADLLEAHLRRRAGPPHIAISDERGRLLETGGGVKHARALLGEAPIFVANIDSVWTESAGSALNALAQGWRPGAMQARLLLAPVADSLGFNERGDFFMDADERLTPRRSLDPGAATPASAPYAYAGVQILDPAPVYASAETAFGLFPCWAQMARRGTLFGSLLSGVWMHVGDPDALAAAERRLEQEEAP